MTPATWGAYVIQAAPYAGAEALRIAVWCVAITGALLTAIRLALWIRDGFRLLRDLMDDGDGQGGVPYARRQQAGLGHLAAIAADQEHGRAEAPTQAMSMRDVVAVPRLQGITACPEFCDDLTSPGNPDACTCTAPCPRAWCTRRREHNPVPVAWEQEKERGWR